MSENNLSLIESLEQILQNIKTFNEELPHSDHLIHKLSSLRHWYYSHKLGMFGPSMFIGYKNDSALNYEKGTSGGSRYMSGWDTEALLNKYAIDLEGQDFRELKEILTRFLKEFDKKPKCNVHIHLID